MRPATADHLKSGKKPATKVVDVVLDPDAARVVQEAESALAGAEAKAHALPDDEKAQEAVWAAQEAYDAAKAQAVADDVVVSLRFRSVGRHAYDELVHAHQPTEEQKADEPNLGFDPDRFPQALVAASLVEPKMSLADVEALWESPDWNTPELGVLFGAALEVNNYRATVDLGKGSAVTRPSEQKSAGA